ncbi:TerD family protein [Flavobacterium sp. K5-23]|uniref:TerD family protein n=1 Tax=Flavobacterium sp. K5-23 TaxID=2746225 RepID=UPI00200D42DC|nr:TerD family protein [Flavobacterium sp. K5-23]UQD57230.1 TerD family protein [Flavobacterium sp. K5-23]
MSETLNANRSSFNLNKGERFSLSKAAPGLTVVKIGMGWDPNEEPNGPDFDLDVSAFAIDSQFKIPSDSYFVFYGQVRMGNKIEDKDEKGLYRPITQDSSIMGAIDDPDGSRSDGDDDEDMFIDLTKVSSKVEQIILCATICKFPHDNKKDRRTLNQNFGQVSNCYIRIVNESGGEEMLRYEMNDKFTDEDAVEFGRLYRVDNTWEFEAMGRAHTGSLQTLVDMYT